MTVPASAHSAATPPSQQLRVLAGAFVVVECTGEDVVPSSAPATSRDGRPDDDWLALVRAPEGLTMIRPLRPTDDPSLEVWRALYGGDTAHGLDVPGMLAALLVPLATAGIPVFVASTCAADLVLVPSARLDAAAEALRAAGHLLVGSAA